MTAKIFNQKYKILAIGALLLLGTLIYSNTLHGSFQFDDERYIVENNALRTLRLSGIWDFYPSRFITSLTFAINYHFNKLNVLGFHIFNLAIHITSAIAVFWLTGIIFSTPAMKEDGLSRIIAVFTALIFLSHPLQTESVTYIWQRCTSLFGLFYLFSLCFYLKARVLQADGNPAPKWKVFHILSFVFALIGMFSKENMITLPLMIILCEFYFIKKNKGINWKYIIPFLFLLPVIPLVLIFARPETLMFLKKFIHQPVNAGGHYFLTQFQVLVTYIRLLFVPVNQNLDYDYQLVKNLIDLPTIASFSLLAVIITFAIIRFSRYRLLSFAIFWFFLTLLPDSSIIPLDDVIYEHRLYLPMFGYSLFLVSSLCYLFKEKNIKFIIAALSLITLCYSTMTYERNKVWKDKFTLWNDVIKKSPHKARPYNNRGVLYANQGNFSQAILDYNKALEVNPSYEWAYINRGVAYARQNNFPQAISDYNKATTINPNRLETYYNRGIAYARQGNFSQAIPDYDKAIKINPKAAEVYINRGVAYARQNNFSQAISDYNKAIAINPNRLEAYYNRGVVYANQGNLFQAISDYTKAIEINPDCAEAYYRRGFAYFDHKDSRKAWEDVHKAESLRLNTTLEFIEKLKTYQDEKNK